MRDLGGKEGFSDGSQIPGWGPTVLSGMALLSLPPVSEEGVGQSQLLAFLSGTFSLQGWQHVLLSTALLLSSQRDPALMVKGIKGKTSSLVALRAGLLSAKADPHSLDSDPEESEGAAPRLP